MDETKKELIKEIEYNIKVCISGINLTDSNLAYHINCLIREVNKKRNAEVKQAIGKIIAESEAIDDYFPKGDKRRGEVLVILAKLNIELLQKLGLEDK